MRDYIEDRALSLYRSRRCPSCGSAFMGGMSRINCKVCQERIERDARDEINTNPLTEVIPLMGSTILNESDNRNSDFHSGGGSFGGGGASGSWDNSSSSSSSYDSSSSYSGD